MKKQGIIMDQIIRRLQSIIKFVIGPHHILSHPRQDPYHQWLRTQFLLLKEEVKAITQDWMEEWRVPFTYDLLSVEEELR